RNGPIFQDFDSPPEHQTPLRYPKPPRPNDPCPTALRPSLWSLSRVWPHYSKPPEPSGKQKLSSWDRAEVPSLKSQIRFECDTAVHRISDNWKGPKSMPTGHIVQDADCRRPVGLPEWHV